MATPNKKLAESLDSEDRDAYLGALDRASIDMDIRPFSTFVAQRVRWSLDRRYLQSPKP